MGTNAQASQKLMYALEQSTNHLRSQTDIKGHAYQCQSEAIDRNRVASVAQYGDLPWLTLALARVNFKIYRHKSLDMRGHYAIIDTVLGSIFLYVAVDGNRGK